MFVAWQLLGPQLRPLPRQVFQRPLSIRQISGPFDFQRRADNSQTRQFLDPDFPSASPIGKGRGRGRLVKSTATVLMGRIRAIRRRGVRCEPGNALRKKRPEGDFSIVACIVAFTTKCKSPYSYNILILLASPADAIAPYDVTYFTG